jgi:hypothetical protein
MITSDAFNFVDMFARPTYMLWITIIAVYVENMLHNEVLVARLSRSGQAVSARNMRLDIIINQSEKPSTHLSLCGRPL